MGKTMFMFPGQGAQYVGMGKAMYDEYAKAREIFDIAAKATGLDIAGLCFKEDRDEFLVPGKDGSSTDKINITEYTQIAMLTVEAAVYAVMEEQGLKCDFTAGLSLGEYGALIAAGVFGFEDAFRVVRQRGIFMQEAVPVGGAMAAVLGLDAEVIDGVCGKTDGYVSIANYNCPGQIVITGEEAAVAAASEALKEAGSRRVVPLNVSGPFHSKMLVPAGERLGKVIDETTINKVSVPYVSNVTAQLVTDSVNVKELLVKQISSSVRWQQTIELMINEGVDTFVEIGPGKTLSGFMKKIVKPEDQGRISTYHIETPEELKAYVER
ncbi:MAG: ACP S-malonyltransferase [Lachnospiraceae bacterium]|nr:ACP S-malonyltransferase [Lachnospiraceae bacterium]